MVQIIHIFRCLGNHIDGMAFMDLSERDICDMIKPLGLVLKITRLKASFSVSCLHRETYSCNVCNNYTDASCHFCLYECTYFSC